MLEMEWKQEKASHSWPMGPAHTQQAGSMVGVRPTHAQNMSSITAPPPSDPQPQGHPPGQPQGCPQGCPQRAKRALRTQAQRARCAGGAKSASAARRSPPGRQRQGRRAQGPHPQPAGPRARQAGREGAAHAVSRCVAERKPEKSWKTHEFPNLHQRQDAAADALQLQQQGVVAGSRGSAGARLARRWAVASGLVAVAVVCAQPGLEVVGSGTGGVRECLRVGVVVQQASRIGGAGLGDCSQSREQWWLDSHTGVLGLAAAATLDGKGPKGSVAGVGYSAVSKRCERAERAHTAQETYWSSHHSDTGCICCR